MDKATDSHVDYHVRSLRGMTRNGLRELCARYREPSYRGDQLARWIYREGATTFDEMTNLPASLRSSLAVDYSVGHAPPESASESVDGTKKYLFRAGVESSERFVEAAYIPEGDRATLCVSTQIGCAMGCLFCMTAKQGLSANLDPGQIVGQYMDLPERKRITNIVYMGMGEPLDNVDSVLTSLEILTSEWGFGMSQKRITVSSIGIIPGIERFLAESKCHLALSLHSPFDDERRRLMPVQNVYPIRDVLELIRNSDLGKQRRVSFEYIVFQGINHSSRHVKELARLTQGIPCRINLIRFHEIPGPLRTATDEEMKAFQYELKSKGITTTIRASRGEDVQAACGLLSTKRLMRNADDISDY